MALTLGGLAFSRVPAATAPTTGFTSTLAPEARTAIGLNHLQPEQIAALDRLIDRDVSSARQGDVVAFAKTFTQRRTPDELRRAGISELNEVERARLDDLVAAAVASRPPMPTLVAPAGTPLPAHVVELKRKWETHGDVSVFVGGSSGGGSFYGGSVDAYTTDPSHRFTVGVGYSEIHTKGLRGCFGDPLW